MTVSDLGEKRNIDLNSILRVLLMLILLSNWYTYYLNGPNEYINFNTIILGSILGIEIFIFLQVERKRRDPFIILLSFQLTFYFLFRILSLSIFPPYSVAFERFRFTPADLNYFLLYIIAANLALFAGFYLNEVKPINISLAEKITPIKVRNIFLLLLFGLLMSFPGTLGLTAIEWILGLLASVFVDVYVIMLMILLFIILFKNKIKKKYKILLSFGLLFFIIIETLAGSRSAIIITIYFVLFAILAVYNRIQVRKSIMWLSLLMVPLLIFVYTITTFLRPRLEKRSNVNSETLTVLKEFDFKEALLNNSEFVLTPIFDRIGYLDYGAELVANQEKYKPIFTYKYYFMSIVDNILTPGFDVFNTPKISNAQKFIYNDEGTPMKSKVDEAYQSDEYTMYGEFYLVFGKWFSLVAMFFLAFFLKRVYVKISGKSVFDISVKRSIILMIFYYFIQSYGMDWIAALALGFYVTYYLFRKVFQFTYLE
jgi:hypothetical protein